jgi:hypothetical protein
MDNILSVAGITTIVSFILTLILQYFPKVRVWWGGVKSEYKSMGFLLGYFIVGAFVAFGGCLAFLVNLIPQLLCVSAPLFLEYVFAVLLAMGAGQGLFALLPEHQEVIAARSERPY